MKRAILLLVVVVGGAFYLGWFTFTTSNDPSGHTEHVNIEINKDKVHADEARAIEKLHSLENQVEQRNRTSMTTLPEEGASAQGHQLPRIVPQNALQTEATSQLAPVPTPYGNQANAAAEEPRPRRRPVAETAAESFSRGFQ